MKIPSGAASDRIAIVLDGVRGIHAVDPTGNYATLCGLDGDDSDAGQERANTLAKRGETIDCRQCYAIWTQCQAYRLMDFFARPTLPPPGG